MKKVCHRQKKGYKLLRLRADGTLGPLFINAKLRVPKGRWLKAEAHRTPGYEFRLGWHATTKPQAPHLSKKGRVWCRVTLRDACEYERPKAQGGRWLLAGAIRVDACGRGRKR